MSRPDEDFGFIALLGEGLATDPATRSFLSRLARVLFTPDQLIRDRIDDLPTLFDAEDVPAFALPALAASTGWSRSNPWVAQLTDEQLRRLVAVAFELRRNGPSERSWTDLLGVLVGRFVLVRTWFDRRAHTGTWGGVCLVPGLASALPGGGPYSYPERVSDVWIEDPAETVDLELAAGLLDRLRPSNERINVYRALWVDTGRRGPGRWSIVGPSFTSWDEATGIATSTGGKWVARVAGGLEDAWRDLAVDFRLRADAGAIVMLGVGLQSNDEDGYIVAADQGTGVVTLYQLLGNALVATLATSAITFGADAWIRWRVEHAVETTGVRIRLLFEGTIVLDHLDASSLHPTGTIAWGAGSTTAVDEQGVLVFPVLPDRARSGPSP